MTFGDHLSSDFCAVELSRAEKKTKYAKYGAANFVLLPLFHGEGYRWIHTSSNSK